MIGITIAPNVNAKPPTDLYLNSLPESVDEWQYYANSQRPTYGYRAAVEAGVIKEYDCTGVKLRKDIDRHVRNCAHLLAMDEPLVASIRPQWEYGTVWDHGHCTALIEELPTIAKRVARFIKHAKVSGLKVSWIEAWPQHEIATWLTALEICEREGVKPDRLVVDYDPFANAPSALLRSSMADLRTWAKPRHVELACIITGHRTTDNETFLANAWKHWRVLYEVGPWDRLIVQSWQRHNGHTVPDTDVLLRIAQQVVYFERAMVAP